MATQEEIVGDIRQLKGEIKRLDTAVGRLETEIGELENKQQLTPTDSSLAVKISEKTALLTAKQNSLTAKQETLNMYLKSQQSKSHHIFPLCFSNLLDVILCPISFDISSSPIQVWRLVRNGGCSRVDETSEGNGELIS